MRFRLPDPAGALLALVAAVFPPTAAAAPISFNTALPVHAGEVIVRTQVVWTRATGDPGAGDRRLDVVAVPLVVAYGLHPRVTLFGILPFLYKNVAVSGASGRTHRRSSGFGDMKALVRVTSLAIDRPGETLRLAPFAGLKVPTGADDETDGAGRLPQRLQPGTGSWDASMGFSFTWQTLRWEGDLSGAYTLRAAANRFEAGDEARGDASLQYRIRPWGPLGEGVPSYLYAVLESNVIWSGADRVAGREDPDSGGWRWYLAPGLQWVTARIVLEGAVRVPVLQRLQGDALREDFTLRLGFRANF